MGIDSWFGKKKKNTSEQAGLKESAIHDLKERFAKETTQHVIENAEDPYQSVGTTIGSIAAEAWRRAHGKGAHFKEASVEDRYLLTEGEMIDPMNRVLVSAATEAAEKFKLVFEQLKTDPANAAKAYDEAVNGAKYVNARHLLELVRTQDRYISEKEIAESLEKADFFAVREMLADMFGIDAKMKANFRKDPTEIRTFLSSIATDAWDVKTIEGLEFTNPDVRLSAKDASILELSFRLANATWAAGQGFKARYELLTKGTTKKGNSETQPNFRVFDDMARRMYEIGEIDRLTLEIMKDKSEVMEFVKQVKGDVEPAPMEMRAAA